MSMEVTMQADGRPSFVPNPGIEFAFLRPDGSYTWVLRFVANEIFVECTLYTRWEKVWRQAHSLLVDAANELASGPSAVAFTMQVIDRFESEERTSKASDIFAAGTLYERLCAVDTLWHQHVGWIEALGDHEMLHNVNVDVLPRDAADLTQGKVVNVLHLQRLRFNQAISLPSLSLSASLGEWATAMHGNNKELLRHTLTRDMKDAIQLDGASK
jgi:uncharacterized protein (TIGR04255 family)